MSTQSRIIVQRLGGARRVSDLLECGIATVYRWGQPLGKGGHGGVIPARWQEKLIARTDLGERDFIDAQSEALARREASATPPPKRARIANSSGAAQ